MELAETFTLGEARSPVNTTLWTREAVACFRQNGAAHLMAIGIDDEAGYRAAAYLDMDAVLADSPHRMQRIKEGIATSRNPLQCPSNAR